MSVFITHVPLSLQCLLYKSNTYKIKYFSFVENASPSVNLESELAVLECAKKNYS